MTKFCANMGRSSAMFAFLLLFRFVTCSPCGSATVGSTPAGTETSCRCDEFPCESGQCIPKTKWCDTEQDCSDNSDEEFCCRKSWFLPLNDCGSEYFTCSNGPCIPKSGECDGHTSCWDYSDEAHCGSTPAETETSCQFGEFPCESGQCISKTKWCDGEKDCSDNSDEKFCCRRSWLFPPNNCGSQYFICSDGPCIPKSGECDGHSSCRDSSDEEHCGPPPTGNEALCRFDEFPCDNGQCILKTKWCDTVENCADDSDENYCSRILHGINLNNCGSQHFICTNGPCIPKSGECDGYASCSDNSDEDHCGPESTELPETSIATSKPHTSTYTESSPPSTSATQSPSTSTTRSSQRQSFTTRTRASTPRFSSSTSPEPTTEMDNNLVSKTPSDPTTDASPQAVSVLEIPELSGHHPSAMDLVRFKSPKEQAVQWLLSRWDPASGWQDTARAVVALYLSDPDYFANRTQEKNVLMSNQLQLQLSMDLVRNDTTPIPLSDLSLYINALLATCNNPRNFHGIDLVRSLRDRTSQSENSKQFISPLVFLTLCALDETVRQDVKRVQDFLVIKDLQVNTLDIMSIATLAASCINHVPKYYLSHIARDSSKRLLRQWRLHGEHENIYSLALLAQALTASNVDGSLWKRSDVMDSILHYQNSSGSFGDILATYYVLPLFSGRTLASVQGHHCYDNEDGSTPLEVLKNRPGTIPIAYSLYFESPVKAMHTLQMKVPEATSFFDIMRLAKDMDPLFRFRYDPSRSPVLVYSMAGIPNDPERGIYWSIHKSNRLEDRNTTRNLHPYTGDLKKLYLTPHDVMVFWLKSVS